MTIARKFACIAIAAAMMHVATANADTSAGKLSGDIFMVQFSPYTIHFDKGPEHTGHPWLVGVEWQDKSRWLAGFSYFNNSFNQKCEYLYGGYTFQLEETFKSEAFKNWYIQLTGGLLYGYKEPFEDKLPINHNGLAPVIIPGLGYKYNRFNAQINILGANGLMFTFGYDLFR